MDSTRHILDPAIKDAVGHGSLVPDILARLGLGAASYRDLSIRLAHMAYDRQVVKVEGFWWRLP